MRDREQKTDAEKLEALCKEHGLKPNQQIGTLVSAIEDVEFEELDDEPGYDDDDYDDDDYDDDD